MTYIAPDLSFDVVLLIQTAPLLPLDVILCKHTESVLVDIDANIPVDGSLSLGVTQAATSGYAPPLLSVSITLVEQLPPPPPLDVILCKPSNDSDVKLSIAASIDVGASIDLTVGNAPSVEINAIDAVISVNASVSLAVTEFVVGISIDTVLPINPTAEIVATYDPNVFRGVQLDVSSDFQYSQLKVLDKSGSFDNGKIKAVNCTDSKEVARLLTTGSQSQFEANIKLTKSEQFLSESAKRISHSSKHQGEYHEFLAIKNSFKNENAKLVGQSDWYGFEAMHTRQTQRKIQGEYSYLDAIMRQTSSDYGNLAGYQYRNLIETAKLPSWFTGYAPYQLWQTIILKQQLAAPTLPLDVVLCSPKSQAPRVKLSIAQSVIDVFGYLVLTAAEDDGTNPQPQKGVIFVTNSVSLTRSDDGREIKLLGFSVGIDSNSYAWSFSATVPLSELSKVDTAHEQQIGVDFTCNGNLWRFVLDSCDDSISFGESSLTIKGKSRAMLLAHPYATQRGFKFDTAMSARQIADAEINRGGVPSGFTLDWQLAGVNGWNIPANTYSYTGKTPINSLQWIAEAAGGFINADMSADILHVLAHYPIPSWEWAAQTPSINLPMSLITSRSRGRINKPSYNGVTLYGENDNGIGALIKRTGTSGGYQPPMVTSDLMTDTAAAISRGTMILSDTGDIGNIGISMPLHADIGVLKPSTLIGVNDGEQWVGMVRGTTITGRLSSNRALEIDQAIDVERHFDKEIV